MNIQLDPETGAEIRSGFRHTLINASTKGTYQVFASGERLMLSGNPTLWLQGHAAFCRYSPNYVAEVVFASLVSQLCRDGYRIVVHHLSKVHLTHMYDAGSVSGATNLLNAFKYSAVKGGARSEYHSDGIYFGKSSKLRCVKVYVDPKKEFPGKCPSYMGRFVRIEVALMDTAIPLHFGDVGNGQFERFLASDFNKIFETETAGLRIVANDYERDELPHSLTNSEIGVLERWRKHDLHGTRAQLRHHRNKIMDKIGIDIYLPPSAMPVPEIVRRQPLAELLRERCRSNFPPPITPRR